MKKLFLPPLFLLCSSILVAQDDFVEKMNQIKLSGKYYTAQSRAETEDKAFEACIRDILSQLAPEMCDESVVRSRVKHMSKPGNPWRVFVYVEKESHAKIDVPPTPQPPAPQPAEVKPRHEDKAAVTANQALLSRLVADLKARPTIGKAFNSFGAKKDLGMVANYGMMKDVRDSDAVYIVIYDSATDELSAILTPVASGSRKNLLTDTPDSYANYHGAMAFWFTIK